jgi:hypothetical protein
VEIILNLIHPRGFLSKKKAIIMYRIITNSRENILAIRFSGKVNKEDYKSLLPIVEEKINKSKKINMYWELVDFEGWDIGSLIQEVKFDIAHAASFNKVAVVGEKKWQQMIASAGNRLTSAEVRFFDKSEQMKAMDWITSDGRENAEEVYKNSSLLD